MNTTTLRYITEFAIQGSAQKTAKILGVNRSSITRNIKKLEEDLSTQLFINTVDGAVPTISGSIFIQYARQILKIEDDLYFDLASDGAQSGNIDLGISLNRAQHVLPFVLPAFHKKFPNVNVRLFERSNLTIENALLNFQIDFALLISIENDGIDFEPIINEPFVFIAPKDDPFTEKVCYSRNGKLYVPLEKFKDLPFILGYPHQRSSKICAEVFKRAGFEANVTFKTKSSMNATFLAFEGMGYSIVPESYTYIGNQQSAQFFYLEPDLGAHWTIGIGKRKGDTLTHASQELKKEIIKAYLN